MLTIDSVNYTCILQS